MLNTYIITMRKTSFISDDLALSYFPQYNVSNLTKAEAEDRVNELNSFARANGWAVDYGMELN